MPGKHLARELRTLCLLCPGIPPLICCLLKFWTCLSFGLLIEENPPCLSPKRNHVPQKVKKELNCKRRNQNNFRLLQNKENTTFSPENNIPYTLQNMENIMHILLIHENSSTSITHVQLKLNIREAQFKCLLKLLVTEKIFPVICKDKLWNLLFCWNYSIFCKIVHNILV